MVSCLFLLCSCSPSLTNDAMPRHDSLNYAAKWDHILDSDEDDEESSTSSERRPRVTRLDQPSTITILPAEAATTNAKDKPTSPAAKPVAQTVTKEQLTEEDHGAQQTTTNNTPTTATDVPLCWTERGAVVVVEDPSQSSSNNDSVIPSRSDNGSRDGACCLCYYWSQDRDTVTIRIPIPNDKQQYSCWNCTVEPILSYRDRQCAVMTTPQTLVVTYRRFWGSTSTSSTTTWLEGTLSRPVHLADEDEDTIDWTIQEVPQSSAAAPLRYLCVTLLKATPMPGLTLWWTQCLPQYEPREIDLTDTTTSSSKSRAWTEAWEEAHEQFRAKMRATQPPPNST